MSGIQSVALIYDNTVHPMTTGEYCRRALENICKVTHFHPCEADNIPQDAFDLYLNIDDSLRYILPVYLKPSAWWVIETDLQYDWYLEKARLFDAIFVARREWTGQFKAEGLKNVFWLPPACGPEIHKKYPCEKNYDWCCAGQTEPGDSFRGPEEMLEKISCYPGNPAELESFAQPGMENARQSHIYEVRMRKLLEVASDVISARYRGGSFGYFHAERPELMDRIPPDVRQVLEVGCGAGVLGESIKRHYGARVVGVELVPGVAAEARNRLDQVIQGDCEKIDFHAILGDERFDCLILGDILEHLREPQFFLQKMKAFLTENASVVASIPNVQNISVVLDLVNGNWKYMEYGILDRTHLRFFTRNEIRNMFISAGCTVLEMHEKFDSSFHRWVNQGKPEQFSTGHLTLGRIPEKSMRDFFVYQYIVEARVRKEMVSIIVLTFNGLEYTKSCLDSVITHTDIPYELIVVDNGSDDDLLSYLERFSGNAGEKMRLIRNQENRGFSYGCNQGITESKGDYIVLLNSDTVVTEGWLSGLLRAADSDPDIGIVGPLTNNTVPGDQMISKTYTDSGGLASFADHIKKSNSGKVKVVSDTDSLVAFCMLVKRDVVDNAGLLDTAFGIGTFEDTDYCWRAGLCGYRLAIAQDVFIHHAGSGSFESNRIDIDRVSKRNLPYFIRKKSINSHKQAEINMEKEGALYRSGDIMITSVIVNSVREGHKSVYRFTINYYAGRRHDSIDIEIRDIRINRVHEIIEEELVSRLRGTWMENDSAFADLSKKAIQDTLDIKLTKLPVPEQVIFLMNCKIERQLAANGYSPG